MQGDGQSLLTRDPSLPCEQPRPPPAVVRAQLSGAALGVHHANAFPLSSLGSHHYLCSTELCSAVFDYSGWGRERLAHAPNVCNGAWSSVQVSHELDRNSGG